MGTLLLTTILRRYHLSVAMAAILAGNNVEEEFLWSCTLNSETKEYVWDPKEPENDPSVKPGHRLLIKSAVLMPSAKVDEVTIVQIESEGYNKKQVVVPICAMKGGADYQQYIDLLVPCPAKMKLLQGEGPIHLIGSHCVDFYGYRDVGAGDSEEEAEDAEMDDTEKPTEGKGDDKVEKKTTPVKVDDIDGKKTPKKDAEKPEESTEDGGSKKRKASEDKSAEEKKKKESPAK